MSRVHDLPHGASIDLDDQIIRIPVGAKIVLKFSLEDFQRFYENMDDLKMILDFHTSTTIYECQTCIAQSAEINYDPPKEEHEN
jgi:hypothetical protein